MQLNATFEHQLNNAEVLNKLNELITIGYDGIRGYDSAAEAAEHEPNRIMFKAHSGQRQDFVSRLIHLVIQFNGEPVSDGHLMGDMHQAWLGLRAALSQGDQAILAECARGDAYAITKYEAMLELGWPLGIPPILKEQLSNLRIAQTKMDELAELVS